MTARKNNLPPSVAARLLNRAKQTGDDYQTLLEGFCFERFLYRLGASSVRSRFVLKDAMLLRLWSDQPYRATRDLDLLRRGDGSFDAIRDDIRTICATPVEPDAVVFDADAVRIKAIRAEDEYAGARTTLRARCGTARLTLQIDMGVGDGVWPVPRPCTYAVLLEFPAPEVLAYPREAVVAEKFEAMVVLGDRNSRIKDFFDLHYLASRFEFDRGYEYEPWHWCFHDARLGSAADARGAPRHVWVIARAPLASTLKACVVALRYAGTVSIAIAQPCPISTASRNKLPISSSGKVSWS